MTSADPGPQHAKALLQTAAILVDLVRKAPRHLAPQASVAKVSQTSIDSRGHVWSSEVSSVTSTCHEQAPDVASEPT